MIQDAAITTAKIASLAVDEARIASGAITNAKLGDASISTAKIQDAAITDAKILNAAVTNAKIANAAIDTAKVGSLFANSLSGDVSKGAAASLGSTVYIANNSNTFVQIIELSLPKPAHPTGWLPYANFHINRMQTDKNSWYHIIIEMAPFNVNTSGGTAAETASTSSTTSAFGVGHDQSSITVNGASIANGATGAYVEVARITWVAVDTTLGGGTFSIAGTWGAASTNVTYGIKARLRVSGDANVIGDSNAAGNIALYQATGFLMGVR